MPPLTTIARRAAQIRPGTETGIDQPLPLKIGQNRAIGIKSLRLIDNRSIPPETDPVEILDHRRDLVGRTAKCIDILDPEQEAPTALTRQLLVQQR